MTRTQFAAALAQLDAPAQRTRQTRSETRTTDQPWKLPRNTRRTAAPKSSTLRAAQVVEARVVREAAPQHVTAPNDVAEYLRTELEAETWAEERFIVFCLDTQNNIRHVAEVSRGILDASLVHPREVFWLAIHERAAAVILAHNHPSGDPTPSAADREVTRQMVDAGRLLGIPVRDHVIIGSRGAYVSFLDAGFLCVNF